MIEPLTPADCDLRALPFMPFDVVRLLDSDFYALSTADEFKAAFSLWCKSWAQVPAASLPNDDRVLAHLSGAGAKWKKVKDMALRGFVLCSDGRLYHPVVAEKAKDAWERRGEWAEKHNNKTERQKRWRDRVKEICEELRSLGVTPPSNATLSTLEGLLVDARPSTGASTVDATETAWTGTGTGTVITVAKATAADAPSDKQFWDTATVYLGGKRSLIGKWCRDFGKDETARAITAAQLDRAVEPVSYVERVLRQRPGSKVPMVGV